MSAGRPAWYWRWPSCSSSCSSPQYESWSVPVAVILSLPVAGIGAYLGIWICGLENNIYFQIGLVMLVGLVAKNAILIVEFAKEEVEKGRDVVSAALTAAHLRFRPIVMTSLAFILGMLPLVFASGPGSASRQGIGTGVFFRYAGRHYRRHCLRALLLRVDLPD